MKPVLEECTRRIFHEKMSRALNVINEAIHADLPLKDIMKLGVAEAAEALQCDSAAVSLRREGRWVVSSAHGFPDDVIGAEMSDDEERHAVMAMQTRRPVAVDDAFNDERFNREHLQKWNIRSVLVVPLLLNHEPHGVIFFNYQTNPVRFAEHHIDFGAKIASALWLALENARIKQHLQTEIAERKRAEEERARLLHESELQRARLEAILESLPVGVWLADEDGKMVQVNEVAHEIWGGTAPKAAGISDYEVYRAWWHDTGERIAAGDMPLARATRGERIASAIIDVERFDGSRGTQAVSAAPVRDRSGKSLGGVTIVQDITKAKEIEEALRQSEERFRKIFEEGPLGAAISDTCYRFLKVNRRFCEMLGFTSEELLGKTFLDLMLPEDAAEATENPVLLQQGKIPHYSVEKRYRHRNGGIVWVTVTVWLMRNSQGEPVQFIATVEDVTEKKKLQEKVLLVAKRDERAKSRKAILAYQDRLRSLASKLSLAQEEERRRIAQQIHDGLGQNLAFCKLKVGQLEQGISGDGAVAQVIDTLDDCIKTTRSLSFELSPVVLYEVGLEAALHWLARQYETRHGLQVSISGSLSGEIPLNGRIILFQAAREFLANVVKHADVPVAEIVVSATKAAVSVTVSDLGSGFVVPPDGLMPDAASGFGLFNIQEQVRNAGGRLEVVSSPTEGTTARVVIPLNRKMHKRKDV